MKLSKLLLIFTLFTLTGCAFHFRDQHSAPPHINNIYIEDQTDDRSGLVYDLRYNLNSLGIHTLDKPCLAPIKLVILTNQFSQITTTLGTAQQLNSQVINYTVTITLKDKNNNTLTPPTTLLTSTSFWQNSNQILGDTGAIPELRKNLVRDMTQKILAYLSASKTQQAIQSHDPS